MSLMGISSRFLSLHLYRVFSHNEHIVQPTPTTPIRQNRDVLSLEQSHHDSIHQLSHSDSHVPNSHFISQEKHFHTGEGTFIEAQQDAVLVDLTDVHSDDHNVITDDTHSLSDDDMLDDDPHPLNDTASLSSSGSDISLPPVPDNTLTEHQLVEKINLWKNGSKKQKIEFVFDLFDLHREGKVRRSSVTKVLNEIFDMFGDVVHARASRSTLLDSTRNHQAMPRELQNIIEKRFDKMDSDSKGFLTFSEYEKVVSSTPEIQKALFSQSSNGSANTS